MSVRAQRVGPHCPSIAGAGSAPRRSRCRFFDGLSTPQDRAAWPSVGTVKRTFDRGLIRLGIVCVTPIGACEFRGLFGQRDLILLMPPACWKPTSRRSCAVTWTRVWPAMLGLSSGAEATLAQLWWGCEHSSHHRRIRKRLMDRIANESTGFGRSAPRRRGDWERIVLPAAIAALLAVAITFAGGTAFHSTRPAGDRISATSSWFLLRRSAPRHAGRDSGHAIRAADRCRATDAVGRVFIDGRNGKWYFFSTGMKPAGHGKLMSYG